MLLRKLEKIRGNVRIEFVCGLRAIRQARQDFLTLSEISRVVSVPFEETAALVTAQVEKAKALEKISKTLAGELAKREGAEFARGLRGPIPGRSKDRTARRDRRCDEGSGAGFRGRA